MTNQGENTVLLHSEILNGLTINGRRNFVLIEQNSKLQMTIDIEGSDNILVIEKDCIIGPSFIGFTRVEGAKIAIGAGTTAGQNFSVQAHETSQITIGADCMFSTNVFLTSSDMHPIFELSTGVRINPAKSISIGNHVWLGYHVVVTKGVVIGEGSVIAAGAVVTGSIPAHSLAGGVPARVLRSDIEWRRNFTD